jgi:hypothetical protein
MHQKHKLLLRCLVWFIRFICRSYCWSSSQNHVKQTLTLAVSIGTLQVNWSKLKNKIVAQLACAQKDIQHAGCVLNKLSSTMSYYDCFQYISVLRRSHNARRRCYCACVMSYLRPMMSQETGVCTDQATMTFAIVWIGSIMRISI